MVEGPGVHRVAIAHRRVLLGRAFVCTSPSGRFTEGAEVINGFYLSVIEAHGKNIFYFFTKHKIDNAVLGNLPEDVIVVHIDFGMSGSFRIYEFRGPERRVATRLRLENEAENVVAHLSAMCEIPALCHGCTHHCWFGCYTTCYACEACQPLVDCVEPPRKKSTDASNSNRTEGEELGAADSDTVDENHVNDEKESSASGSVIKKRVSNRTNTSRITFRRRKVLDGKIVEHQALKVIPAGGLVDFPSSLDDVIWPSVNPKSLKEGSMLCDASDLALEGSQEALIDLSTQVENEFVKRRSRRIVGSEKPVVDVSTEEKTRREKKHSMRSRKSNCSQPE